MIPSFPTNAPSIFVAHCNTTVMSLVKILLWLVVPLQRSTIVSNCWWFTYSGGDTATRKDYAKDVGILVKRFTGSNHLVSEYSFNTSGMKVLLQKCELSGVPSITRPTYPIPPQAASLLTGRSRMSAQHAFGIGLDFTSHCLPTHLLQHPQSLQHFACARQ
jgi:hypothetical protein